jgi:hypothetical protein
MIPEDLSYAAKGKTPCIYPHSDFDRSTPRFRFKKFWWLLLPMLIHSPITAQSVKQHFGYSTGRGEKAMQFPMDHSEIRYTPDSRRDPFLDPLRRLKQLIPTDQKIPPAPLRHGIAGTRIDELEFEGVSLRDDRRLAIIRAADNRAYFLEEGDRLFDGYLKSIQAGSIILVRESKLTSGKILTQDITRHLRKP